jgi:hypothetical protein
MHTSTNSLLVDRSTGQHLSLSNLCFRQGRTGYQQTSVRASVRDSVSVFIGPAAEGYGTLRADSHSDLTGGKPQIKLAHGFLNFLFSL